MVAGVRYTIGAGVRCTDGECGSVARVVIDPVARQVTHLVVDPGKGHDRLVPVSLVDGAAEGIKLTCDLAEFAALESAEEEWFLPGRANDFGYDPDQTVTLPYFGPNIALAGMAPLPLSPTGGAVHRVHERVPAGEVQIRRGEHVEATDGDAGRVQGLVVDDRDRTVTHVLLSEGHLWGRKTVAVPIADVDRTGTTIRVAYTKDQLKEFPEIDLAPAED